jgi:hypothetical protein
VGTEETPQVGNPYKAAIAAAIGRARPVAAHTATALDSTVAAMRGEAWVSPLADQFFAALTAQDNAAKSAGDECVAALQRAHDGQPDKVHRTAWQIHWRNL